MKPIIKVIIAGGRDFRNYQLACYFLDSYFKYYADHEIRIISGKARGADYIGEQYAQSRGFAVEEFPADWERYGKAAGAIRNSEMANVGTHCIAFWDGKSRGTKHMIKTARQKGLIVEVVRY